MMQKTVPDCMTCWKRETCERAQEGTFCAEWQSREPKEKHPTPDELWERGETPFDDM